MKNVVSVGGYSFTVTKKNRPYSNDFVVVSAEVVPYNGTDEIKALVKCAEGSREAGMYYSCVFSTTGELLGCMN